MGSEVPQAAEVHFARRLREYREVLGMSGKAVAEAMRDTGFSNFSQQTIDRMEHGTQRPRLGEFLALAEILGVEPHYLLRPDGVTRAATRIRRAVRAVRAAERDILRGRSDLADARSELIAAVTLAEDAGLLGQVAEENSLAAMALRDTEDLA